jgi:hypothetical protein
MGIVTIARMATDIFPKIDIPVMSVIWSFPGVAPEEMEKRFVTVTERAMTTTVNDIEDIAWNDKERDLPLGAPGVHGRLSSTVHSP